MIYVLVGLLIGLFLGFLFVRKRPQPYLARAEYWVYSKVETLPSTDKLMVRLVGDNPHIQKGVNPIGGAEGLIFSDVRLKIALLLQKKNPQLFEGKLLPEAISDHHEFVSDVGSFKSIVKLQYISTTKLKDKRHLQFLMHAAEASAEITESIWILDKVSGILRTRDEQSTILRENFNATKLEFHVRLDESEDHTFSSYGLSKIGVCDFDTHPVSADQMSLVREILERYMSLSWERGEAFPDPIKAYDDEFILLQSRPRKGRTVMRIVRKQMKS